MTDQPARTALISDLAWPTWNQTSEAHGVGYDKAVELTDAHAAEASAAALHSASEQMRIGIGTGPIDHHVRKTVAAWLDRLATNTERRARANRP